MFTTRPTLADVARPLLIPHRGRLAWQFADGTIRAYVGGAAEGDDEKKFTQADVDRLIQERIARVKAEPPADYNDLKTKAAELDKLKAAADAEAAKKLTADEATAKRIADLEAAVAKSTAAVEEANAKALAEKRRAAIVAAAATQKAANPDQVAALLDLEQKHKDAVTIGDDGRVTGADEAVKAFLADSPHFVGASGRPKPDPGQGNRTDAKETGSAGRAEAAKRFGTPATTATK